MESENDKKRTARQRESAGGERNGKRVEAMRKCRRIKKQEVVGQKKGRIRASR